MAPILVDGSNDIHYTVFVRLPFARNDFVDPPPVGQDWMFLKAGNS